jgi:hypothetical protein
MGFHGGNLSFEAVGESDDERLKVEGGEINDGSRGRIRKFGRGGEI